MIGFTLSIFLSGRILLYTCFKFSNFIPRPAVVVGAEVVESAGTEAVGVIAAVEGVTVSESNIVESNVNWKSFLKYYLQ